LFLYLVAIIDSDGEISKDGTIKNSIHAIQGLVVKLLYFLLVLAITFVTLGGTHSEIKELQSLISPQQLSEELSERKITDQSE